MRSRKEKRIEFKLKITSKEKDYMKKLSEDCNTWLGPFIPGEELIREMKLRPEKENFVVQPEMTYFTHTAQVKYNNHNYTNCKAFHLKKKLENLLVLLSDDSKVQQLLHTCLIIRM